MAEYNFTDGSITGVRKPHATTPASNCVYTRSNVIDCALQTLDAGDGDTGIVIQVPADTWVLSVALRTITAETANGTVDIGVKGGDTDAFGDALAIDAAAGGVLTLWAPSYFAAAGQIIVTATTDTADVDIDGWKAEIVALMVPGSAGDDIDRNTPETSGSGD